MSVCAAVAIGGGQRPSVLDLKFAQLIWVELRANFKSKTHTRVNYFERG
jgi:hypothetical protein